MRRRAKVLDPNAKTLQDVETPALILDEAAVKRNVAKMAGWAKASGILLRPHAKTHKSLEIAKLQLSAGAVGISCATVAEIEAFSRSRIPGLLLTTPVANRPKLERLARVVGDADVSIVIDHVEQLAALNALMRESSRPVRVLIDVDLGQKRTGVCDVNTCTTIAKKIADYPAFSFGGLQGFAGQVQHIVRYDQRENAAAEAGNLLNEYLSALHRLNIKSDIVTGSGTGTAEFDARGPYTELQVGSYVFMDADYGALLEKNNDALPYEKALFVLATVTSINRPGEFTIDAGVKALAFNGPMPSIIAGAPSGSTYRFAGDEHGIITMPAGCTAPALGMRVMVEATHCDPTVNLHSRYTVVKEDDHIEHWPILARYEN
jgi:D-serine deaminase-like pyridoxal phosphate-dependent protein